MKKTIQKFLIITLMFCAAGIEISAQTCASAPSGLVSWYRAENNANDSKGSNHGTLQNGATFAAGRVGQAFSFDGVNDFVSINNGSSLDFGTRDFSVELWLNLNDVSGEQTLFIKRVGTFPNSQEYLLETGVSGGLRFLVRDTTSNQNDLVISNQISANTWYHFAAVRQGGNSKIYLNGTLVGDQTAGTNVNTGTGGTAVFGALLDVNARFVNGRIDEPAFYNRALSQTEIQAIFNAGNAGKCVSTICAAPSSNLISWYRSQNNAVDALNANNGTLQNGATFAAGKVGQGFSFDGIDDFVQLPSNSSLNPVSTTVEGWIKPESGANGFGAFIYASRDPFSAEGFSVFVGTDNSLRVDIRTANAPSSSPTFFSAPNVIQNGQFQHVAVTYNATGGTLAAFINGANVPLSGGMILSGAIQPSNNHFIGRRQDAANSEGNVGAGYFKGSIDELSIYSRALSQSEIQAVFNAGSDGKCQLRRTQFDFDGDGRADISVFRPANTTWFLRQPNAGFTSIAFGASNDLIAPADFDGDGRADVAVFRPSNGTWFLQRSQLGLTGIQFGATGDLPRPGDFDGDRNADIAVFRPSSGTWFIRQSSNNQDRGVQFGQSGDVPMMADFDGDGKTDIAVFRPSNGTWYWLRSSDGQFRFAPFGQSGDIPVNGDFTGDGRSDLAVFRPSNGFWYVARETGTPAQNFEATQFSLAGDIPVPADYDGDGQVNIAVYRPSEGNWYVLQSGFSKSVTRFGAATDKPVPSAFQP